MLKLQQQCCYNNNSSPSQESMTRLAMFSFKTFYQTSESSLTDETHHQAALQTDPVSRSS